MILHIFGREFAAFAYPAQGEKVRYLIARYIFHPAVIAALIVFLVCVVVYGFAAAANKPLRRVSRLLPAGYLLVIASLALLNRTPGEQGVFLLRFDYILAGETGFHETRVLMGIFDFLYYIPFGCLLRVAFPEDGAGYSVGFASFTGLLMEALQCALGLGVGTAEHWLLYTGGAASGVAVYSLCKNWRGKRPRGRALHRNHIKESVPLC